MGRALGLLTRFTYEAFPGLAHASSRNGEKKVTLPQNDDQQKHDHSHDQNREDCYSFRSVVFVYAQSINPLTPRKWA
jgi:hypothetical protein